MVSPELPPDEPHQAGLSRTHTERPVPEDQLGRALSDLQGPSRKAPIVYQDRCRYTAVFPLFSRGMIGVIVGVFSRTHTPPPTVMYGVPTGCRSP